MNAQAPRLDSMAPAAEVAVHYESSPKPPVFATHAEERLYRKRRMAAAFRLFSKFGFDDGLAGHITARDPEFPDTFWLNPFGLHFSLVKVSSLIRVDHDGNVVEGTAPANRAAFAIHSAVHAARPDSVAAAHTHALYGKTWSSLGRLLEPINQDACAFHRDHSIYRDFGGVAFDLEEGKRIAEALGPNKAVILQNHGLLTVGRTVDEAAWWYIAMERCCQSQLLAEAAGNPHLIEEAVAVASYRILGTPYIGWFQFQPLYDRIVREQPDLLD